MSKPKIEMTEKVEAVEVEETPIDLPPTGEKVDLQVAYSISGDLFVGKKVNLNELQKQIEAVDPLVVVSSEQLKDGTIVSIKLHGPADTNFKKLLDNVVSVHSAEKTDREEADENNVTFETRLTKLELAVFGGK